MGANYQLIYKFPNGKTHGLLQFSSIQYGRKENDVGWMIANIKPIYPPGFFDQDGTLEVWRSVNGGASYLEMETVWWNRKARHYTDSNGVDGIELTAHDSIGLINRRIVAYGSGTTYSEKSDNADNSVKAIMRENFGSLAFDTSRDLSQYITIQNDASFGAASSKSVSWGKCLQMIQEIAKESERSGLRVVFDMVMLSSGKLEFRTYSKCRGVDHSSSSKDPIVISQESGSLSAPELIYDYTQETNVAYAGGRDVGASRVVEVSEDSVRLSKSPWNRCEEFIDARNSMTTGDVLTEARYGVVMGQPRLYFNGSLLQTPNKLYGVHYGYGDIVTAQYKGQYFDCRIDSIQVKVDNSGESISCSLRGDYALGQGYNVS